MNEVFAAPAKIDISCKRWKIKKSKSSTMRHGLKNIDTIKNEKLSALRSFSAV